MKGATGLIKDREVEQVVTRENLLTLASFCDKHATAVSFGFGRVTTPDESHHEEVIAIKGMVQQAIAQFAPEPVPLALTKDLEQILEVAEEIRLNPARLRLVLQRPGFLAGIRPSVDRVAKLFACGTGFPSGAAYAGTAIDCSLLCGHH
jgi:hypothetical protein